MLKLDQWLLQDKYLDMQAIMKAYAKRPAIESGTASFSFQELQHLIVRLSESLRKRGLRPCPIEATRRRLQGGAFCVSG